ncbi:MAG: STAS domain-containing protein [Phycisphaeraceae bacterium]
MKIKLKQQGDIAIVTLTGECIEGDHVQVHQKITEFLGNGGRDIVLDCSQVQSIDSRCLEALLTLQEEVVDRLGRLVIGDCSEVVDRILYATRLTGRFEREASIEKALETLGAAA